MARRLRLLSVALAALSASPAAAADPNKAFALGVAACETALQAAGPTRSPLDQAAGFATSGFTPGALSGRTAALALSSQSAVFSRAEAGSEVVVIASAAPSACRIAAFDAGTGETLASAASPGANSGWRERPVPPSPNLRARAFEKVAGPQRFQLHISWPTDPSVSPQGLRAMATMVAQPTEVSAETRVRREAGLQRLQTRQGDVAKYVRVAVAWHVDQSCRVLDDTARPVFDADVAAATRAIRALMADAQGSEMAAQPHLVRMQEQARAYATANYAVCGDAAKAVVTRGQTEAREIVESRP